MTSLADSVRDYYREDPAREERLRVVLDRQAGFSLRDIDWYVTNMSARKPQVFFNPSTGRVVDVNSDYKDALRCYHKSSFDSFRRKGSGDTPDDRDLKQRNFFRWALENGIVDRVADSIKDIKEDMTEARHKRSLGSAQEPRKRHKGCEAQCPGITIVREPRELKIPTFTGVVW